LKQRHGEIWKNHEAELIVKGFLEPQLAFEPARDLVAEIDALKSKDRGTEIKEKRWLGF